MVIPDYKTYADFFAWTKELPNIESPAWSGLPMNVEKLNQIRAAELLIFNTNVIQGTGDDLDQGDDEGENAGAKWMVTLKHKVVKYYDLLPLQLDTLKRVGHMVKNPLFRFLEREVSVLSSLLQKVRSDLKLVMDVCTGEKKSSNYTKSITEPLCAEKVPEHWKKYIVPAQMTATEWITDFQRRVDQVHKLASSGNQDSAIRQGIWFGGLLAPEAYLIATQQATAQQHGWSLEELELKVDFDPTQEDIDQIINDAAGFIVRGLAMESAAFDMQDRKIKLASELSSSLPTMLLRWLRKDTNKTKGKDEGTDDFVMLPLYLNRSRKNLVYSLKMPTFGLPQYTWYQRGVAMFAS